MTTYTLELITWDGKSEPVRGATFHTEAVAHEIAAHTLTRDDRRYAAVKIMAQHIHVAARTAMWMEL